LEINQGYTTIQGEPDIKTAVKAFR